MATSTISLLIDAIYDQTAAACAVNGSGFEHVEVIDGPGGAEGGDSVQVGVSDPDTDDLTQSGSSAEVPGPYGTNRARNEQGMVWLTITSWSGNDDDPGMRATRERVEAIAGVVAGLCRTTGNFGVNHVLRVSYGTSSSLWQGRDDAFGVKVRLTVAVGFFARI